MKDFQILFKRLPKYTNLILKIKKIYLNKVHRKNVNDEILFQTKYKCKQTNLF